MIGFRSQISNLRFSRPIYREPNFNAHHSLRCAACQAEQLDAFRGRSNHQTSFAGSPPASFGNSCGASSEYLPTIEMRLDFLFRSGFCRSGSADVYSELASRVDRHSPKRSSNRILSEGHTYMKKPGKEISAGTLRPGLQRTEPHKSERLLRRANLTIL